jgi:hypothetical protein
LSSSRIAAVAGYGNVAADPRQFGKLGPNRRRNANRFYTLEIIGLAGGAN